MVIEDNAADLYLIREAIEVAGIVADFQTFEDGEDARSVFEAAERDPEVVLPEIILLDLNLPRISGEDVLRHLRATTRSRNIAVLVVTSSDSSRDREGVMKLGARGYFRKPSEYDEFLKLGARVRDILAEPSEQ